jgi:hypothetical protein
MLFRLLIQAPSVDHTTRFIKPIATAIGYMRFMVLEFGDFSNESAKIRGSKNLVISSIPFHGVAVAIYAIYELLTPPKSV